MRPFPRFGAPMWNRLGTGVGWGSACKDGTSRGWRAYPSPALAVFDDLRRQRVCGVGLSLTGVCRTADQVTANVGAHRADRAVRAPTGDRSRPGVLPGSVTAGAAVLSYGCS